MRVIACLVAGLLLAPQAWAGDSGVSLAPSYSAASIVNSATSLMGALAPNTIATIYGEYLSFDTRGLTAGDVKGGLLPTTLPGTGATILINNIAAHLYYVSPTQINFLIPNDLLPGRARLQLTRDGRLGPKVEFQLRQTAPALFQLDQETAIAVRADGSVATAGSPAHPGEIIVLYATGLGETQPRFPRGQIPMEAAQIAGRAEFQVLLDRAPVPAGNIDYVGVAPGNAGLYQINVWLPVGVGDNPQSELLAEGEISPPGLRIPVKR
jgi:uncharacterized protein (TIGR03437 family)